MRCWQNSLSMIRVRFPAYQLNAWILSCFLFLSVVCGESIRVATYNLDNYLVTTRYVEGVRRPSYPKPEAEKAAVRSTIQEAMPDILVLQEIGPLPFLKELQADLAQEGIIYSHAIHMQGDDTVRHLAVLSTQAPVEVVRHQDLAFKYQDQAGHVHIVGLAAVSIVPSRDNPEEAAQVETANIGVMLNSTALSSGVSLGYNSERVVYVQPDSASLVGNAMIVDTEDENYD